MLIQALTVHVLYKLLTRSLGIVCGAETISNAFELLAASKIRHDMPNRAYVIDQMRRDFDKKYKHTFGDTLIKRSYVAGIPGARDDLVEFS
jgi:hypothetical protein